MGAFTVRSVEKFAQQLANSNDTSIKISRNVPIQIGPVVHHQYPQTLEETTISLAQSRIDHWWWHVKNSPAMTAPL
jgi:hypothetical protein